MVLIAIIMVVKMAIITIIKIIATIAIMASQNKSHHKPWYRARSLCLCVLGGGQGSCTARTEDYTCFPQVREYRHILRC